MRWPLAVYADNSAGRYEKGRRQEPTPEIQSTGLLIGDHDIKIGKLLVDH